MKYRNRVSLVTICYLIATVLSGCTIAKELGKGFMGVSTQVLEDKRKDALKKSFALDYDRCYIKVKEILKETGIKTKIKTGSDTEIEIGTESPIYAEDVKKKMIAIYLTQTDTTPVGIFFTKEAENKTLIEVSSPSIYAKEETANRIFTGIDELIKPKI